MGVMVENKMAHFYMAHTSVAHVISEYDSCCSC